MSFMDKVKFWKKEDDFDDLGMNSPSQSPFSTDFSDSSGLGGLSPDPHGFQPEQQSIPQQQFRPQPRQQQPQFQQTYNQQQTSFQPRPEINQYESPKMESNFEGSPSIYLINKNIEIVSSKLDALKAAIDSLSQRLASLERIAYGEQEGKNRYW